MRRFILMLIVMSCLFLLPFVSQSMADTVKNRNLGFSLKLSDKFIERPDVVESKPDIVHAFQFGEATEAEFPVLLIIEKLGGTLGRERLEEKQMPPGFTGKIFITTWQEFEVEGFETPGILDGSNFMTYTVQIPLKGEAIQVAILGPEDRKDELKLLLRQVLDNLNGESNWLSSIVPSNISNSENYGIILLSIAIVGFLAGLVILWLLPRRSPSGTVLLIAILLFMLSGQLHETRVREIIMLMGLMRMLGIIAFIIGIYDVCRKRKTALTESNELQPAGAAIPEDESRPPVP